MPSPPTSALDRPLRVIDLFCGAGGLSEGFSEGGYDVVYALDQDEDSCRTYAHNHPNTMVECVSITDRTPSQIEELAGGTVDVIVGGPSCQSFSTAGRKNGWVRKGDERNDLWRHMFAVVEHFAPSAFLLENVPGLVYFKKGEFGATILERFKSLGYSVSKSILLAADFGVPQRRRRLFIVGLLGDEEFDFPSETHLGGWRRDYLELWEKRRVERGLERHLRTWEAIGDLPSPSTTSSVQLEVDPGRLTPFARRMRREGPILDHEKLPIPEEHLELIRHVPAGGTWRDIPRHFLPDRFRGMRRTDSTNLLGRLAPELPAYTITTQFNNVTTGCYTHPYEDRALTIREAARLQTFPDSYEFLGDSITSRCRQVGNAVPPLLGHVLAAQIARSILGPEAADRHPAPDVIKPAANLPAPPPTDRATRRRMTQQKRTRTKPEEFLAKELRRLGLRPRVNEAPLNDLSSKADLVFRRDRVAVFVHGCFWHGCPEHFRPTKSNTKWWADKIAANKRRDAKATAELTAAGWTVLVVWEHEEPATAAQAVAAEVRERRSRTGVPTQERFARQLRPESRRAALPRG